MKINKILMSGLLMMGCLSMTAQEEAKTEYVFNPHWYVQAQVGGQYTLGEIDFKDLVSLNVQAGLGYKINPVIGLRLNVNAWQSKGGWKIANTYNEWKWNYVAPAVNVTCDLTNLIGGFNPNRLVSVGLFLGGGVNVAWKNDEAVAANSAIQGLHASWKSTNYQPLEYLWTGTKARIFGQGGVTCDFRVSNAVSIGAEIQANLLNDKYNSKRAGNADWTFNALVGVKIALGKTHSTRKVEAPEPQVKVVEKIVEKIVEVPATNTNKRETVEEKFPLRKDIFFALGKTVITDTEMAKVQAIADYLNKYPEAKVKVTGYADAKTGSDKINDRIGAKRAEIVVKTLKEKFNISDNRISYESKGARVQPYAENDRNRVSICIAD